MKTIDYELGSRPRFRASIFLDFTLNNERIEKQVYEFINNLCEYKYCEWRIICHDGHGGVIDLPFSIDKDDDVSIKEGMPNQYYPDRHVGISIYLNNTDYLKNVYVGKEKLAMVHLSTEIRNIEMSEDEVVFSEWL